MRCKGCDYPLWNLRARECPECGLGFRPSEFEFTLNSVRFCCPGCGQEYYGTGARGHLVPESFQCVSCGKPVTMDECVLLPTAGVEEEQTKVDEMPWFERSKKGVIAAWFSTVGRSMVAPGRLMDAIPEGAPSGFVFGTVTTFLISLMAILPFFVLVGGVGTMVGGGGGRRAMNVFASVAGGAVGTVVGALVGAAILLALWVVCAHAMLKLTGETAHPMKRTCQALSYSAGANVLCAIPCLSVYFGWLFVIWWIVAAAIMLARGQRVSGARATAAVVVPPLVLGVGLGGWLAFVIYAGVTAATTALPQAVPTTPAPTPAAVVSAATVLRALKAHAISGDVDWPSDPDELVNEYIVTDADFYPLTFPGLPMPAGVQGDPIAWRHGDYVFTFFGVSAALGNPDLWLFIQTPSPSGAARFTWTGPVYVGGLDGVVREYALGTEFDERLAMQNELRAKAGLPPLPDPTTVRVGSPIMR